MSCLVSVCLFGILGSCHIVYANSVIYFSDPGFVIHINLTFGRARAWWSKDSSAFVTDSNRNSNTRAQVNISGWRCSFATPHTVSKRSESTVDSTLAASSLCYLFFHCHQCNHGCNSFTNLREFLWHISDPNISSHEVLWGTPNTS